MEKSYLVVKETSISLFLIMHIIKRKSSEFFIFFENLYDIVDMKIKLLIRRTQEYYDYLIKKDIPCPHYLQRIKSIWDKHFKITYDDYRRELSKIAYSTYEHIGFDEIIPFLNEDFFKNEKQSIIVPIDEDDWLCPNIVPILKQVKTDHPFICWKSVYRDTGSDPLTDTHHEMNTVRYFTSKHMPHIVSSSYAINLNDKTDRCSVARQADLHNKMPLFNDDKDQFYHILEDTLAIKVGSPASLYLYKLCRRILYETMMKKEYCCLSLLYYCKVKDSINKQMKDLTYPSSFPPFFYFQWDHYVSLLKQL